MSCKECRHFHGMIEAYGFDMHNHFGECELNGMVMHFSDTCEIERIEMVKYIKADKVAKIINEIDGSLISYMSAVSKLENLAAENVREIVPGWWKTDGERLICSNCGFGVAKTAFLWDPEGRNYVADDFPFKYCPNCGAECRN